jgi:hypothetical protein
LPVAHGATGVEPARTVELATRIIEPSRGRLNGRAPLRDFFGSEPRHELVQTSPCGALLCLGNAPCGEELTPIDSCEILIVLDCVSFAHGDTLDATGTLEPEVRLGGFDRT